MHFKKRFFVIALICALSRAAFSFNYTDIKWKTFETNHFIIHYYDDVTWTAQKSAQVAEEIYPEVTGFYKHRPKKKTHLIVRDDEDTSNGFAVYGLNSVTIWAGPSSHRLRGKSDWIRGVITHEFSHIVSLQASTPLGFGIEGLRFGGVSNADTSHNTDVGATLLVPTHPYSRWWAEGTAQLDTATVGHDPWDSMRDTLLRAATLEDNLLTFDQMRNITTRENFGGEMVYNQGFAFLMWLRKTYGEDVNAKLAHAFSKGWQIDIDRSLKKMTGKSGRVLYQEWVTYLKQYYTNQTLHLTSASEGQPLYTLSKKALLKTAPLEKKYQGNVYVSYPKLSPDGLWFSWIHRDTLYLQRLPAPYDLTHLREGMTTKEIKLATKARYYSWSPDSQKIVLSKRLPNALGGYPYHDLYLVDVPSKKEKLLPKRLTHKERATHPAWSPDGQWIAYSTSKDGHRHLKRIRPNGKDAEELVAVGGDSEATESTWSPDSKKLAYTFFHQNQSDIWLLDLESKKSAPLMLDSYDDRDGQFSKGGQHLIFSSDRSGVYQLYDLDLSTRTLQTLTDVKTGAFMPYQAPGNETIYLRFSSYGFKLYELRTEKPLAVSSLPPPPATEMDSHLKAETFPSLPAAKNYRALPRPLRAFPTVLVENNRFKMGVGFQVSDQLEKHSLFASALFGRSQDYQVAYTNNMLPPTITGSYTSYVRPNTFRAVNDGDGINDEPDTVLKDSIQFLNGSISQSFDLRDFFDGKHTVALNYRRRFVDRHVGYPTLLNSQLITDFRVIDNHYGTLSWNFFRRASSADRDFDINPRNYQSLTVNHSLIHTNRFLSDTSIPSPNKNYFHQESTVAYEQAFSLSKLSKLRWHSLWFKFNGGYKSRDVTADDEFFLGGRINYRAFGQIADNTQFWGYEDFSISGETLLMGSFGYTFPIQRAIDRRFGPFFLDSFYASLFYEAGNVWDYGQSRNRANGAQLLHGVGMEIKMKAFIFNDYNNWNSSLRVAHGFQDNAAQGFTNSDSPVRVYLGIGTDF